LAPSKSPLLEDSPTSEEDDNRGEHPNTEEATSLNGALTPSIFSPTDWDDGREDPPTSIEGMTTPLGRSHAEEEAYRPHHEKAQVPENSEDPETKEGC
jgi:hypothetical protein